MNAQNFQVKRGLPGVNSSSDFGVSANVVCENVPECRFLRCSLVCWNQSTGEMESSGTQLITDPGDFARFGTMLFQLLAPVQLVLAIFFAATLAASAVGQEKERGTLTLFLQLRY